jgi:hypothetical protein
MLMQSIHLAIGVVEGLVTAAVVGFIWKARPEIIEKAASGEALGRISVKKVLAGLAIVAVITGGIWLFDLIKQLNGSGKTLVTSTHNLDIVDEIVEVN